MGVIGISYNDFCRLRPCDFEAMLEASAQTRNEQVQSEWERMRLLATITVQPHCKKRISPKTLLPLPWDKNKAPRTAPVEVSRNEAQARFNKLIGKG